MTIRSDLNMWLEDGEKPDFNSSTWGLDPIAKEAVFRKRELYTESLFQPILAERMEMPVRWIVDGWLPRGSLAVLAGDPKAGKTSFATALALAVATGTPFAGMNTKQSGVLWLAGEETPAERYELLAGSPLADPATPLYTCYQHLPIDSSEGLTHLQTWIGKAEASLLVVDPLYMATSGRSMADAAAARRSLMPLKQLCGCLGISALVLHHAKTPHSGYTEARVAESAQLAASASVEWILSSQPATREPEQHPARVVTLTCRGRGAFANRRLRFLSEDPLHYAPMDPTELAETPEQTNWREEAVLALISKRPITTERICERLNMAPGTLRNCITNLRRRGQIRIVKVVKKERLWGLASQPARPPQGSAPEPKRQTTAT